jgi:hypothetical protein
MGFSGDVPLTAIATRPAFVDARSEQKAANLNSKENLAAMKP